MPLSIRPATLPDLATVVEFNLRLAEESEGKALDRGLLEPGVAAALTDPAKGPYLLAVRDGRPVGQMAYTFEWSDWRNGWFWWIQSVYVRPEARRQGVFRALFEELVRSARHAGNVIGIRLYVDAENEAGQATYRNLGLVKTNYGVMERYPLA
jgi:GNAT superfamily N-acetyltransferase